MRIYIVQTISYGSCNIAPVEDKIYAYLDKGLAVQTAKNIQDALDESFDTYLNNDRVIEYEVETTSQIVKPFTFKWPEDGSPKEYNIKKEQEKAYKENELKKKADRKVKRDAKTKQP